ncbi:ATP-binding protein [Thalassococcus sp. S3]|uniref:sensor histidine kinase n=1 Tax=Thalassococcus sp. S3 TaxID=2017482 RepID=UPI0010245CB8|nr:ATP-binding protein [Thalassococcus sp. S3]QBF31429.1 C4-dicarboxylate ABC transporter [Thalassococcus sp. S3]
MTGFIRHRTWVALGFGVLVLLLAANVWRYGYQRAIDQLARRAEADLVLASDRLSAQLQRYRELAVLMAQHPSVAGLDEPVRRMAAKQVLLDVSDKTAALDMVFANREGTVLVSAHGVLAQDVSRSAAFRRAMQGALGNEHWRNPQTMRRAFSFAAPSFGADGKVEGALIVSVDVEDIEQTWRGSTPTVLFTDQRGEVFISNRSELLYWSRPAGEAGLIPADGRGLSFAVETVGQHEIWRMGWGPYLPQRALHLERELPVIQLVAEVLVDVQPARALATLQAGMLSVFLLAAGALAAFATERRRTLARANAVLESRVAERTQALSRTNAQLRREITERQEAEAALKQAQADLVQAGKLSALGQMSAGISHELNQPLMAIQSFAENGAQFLDRGRPEMASENLGRITDLARRMGRIIRNLRAFARQESAPSGQVDLRAVLQGAIELTEPRMHREGVTLRYEPSSAPMWVRGGEVRLGQVFVNLITNAMDAMAESDVKDLNLLVREGTDLIVELSDTGPGIENPDKVFDPFYTTKAVGGADGMGLGLSISYGIVQSFGGDIHGENLPDGGAVFRVHLERWDEKEAAA